MLTMKVELWDESVGDSVVHTLPAQWVICDSCKGEGGTSKHLGAFSRDDIDELGDEWLEDYVAGAFDRPCEDCKGSGKVLTYRDGREHYTDEQYRIMLAHMEQEAERVAEEYQDRRTRWAEDGYRGELW